MDTKQDLDQALAQVTHPAPLILIGPGFPINRFEGYNDPFEGWYRGCRVEVHPGLGEGFDVLEAFDEEVE